jgi:hypothetical protein
MRPSSGIRSADPIPGGFEMMWSDHRRFEIAARWRKLTRRREHILRVPNILGECGWWVNGVLVNADVIDYQERIDLIDTAGLIKRFAGTQRRVLEIGGGYGALCYGLTSILNPSQYVICRSRCSSRAFTFPWHRARRRGSSLHESFAALANGEICLLPNYLAQEALASESFDLVINTLSKSEMSPHQVSIYGAMISKLMGTAGVFFEQNHDNQHLGMIYCKEHLRPFFQRSTTVPPSAQTTSGIATIWSN